MIKQAKIPGPDHPITIRKSERRVRVTWRGKVVADTEHALDLQEGKYPVVHYIPRADVKMDLLERTDLSTHCPYKGDATYYSLVEGLDRIENAIWSYERPFDAVSDIEDYLAFYPSKVEKIETV